EIAHSMSATTPVVRQLVHRARTRLRDACGVFMPVWALRWLVLADLRTAGSERVGEAVAGGATGAGLMKAGTALLATGAIATGAGRHNRGLARRLRRPGRRLERQRHILARRVRRLVRRPRRHRSARRLRFPGFAHDRVRGALIADQAGIASDPTSGHGRVIFE